VPGCGPNAVTFEGDPKENTEITNNNNKINHKSQKKSVRRETVRAVETAVGAVVVSPTSPPLDLQCGVCCLWKREANLVTRNVLKY
jgi:hypothetical protein